MSLAGIDVDPATWVRNKLGTDDLWNYGNAANLLNNELLSGIEDNFHTFDVRIKLKLLLSFLQIPRRNIEELSDELFRIVQLAESDGDDWVKVVASMLKEYPRTARVQTDLSDHSSTFQQIVEDIGVAVKHSSGNGPLPMECPYLNRTALNHLVGQQQGPAKHFTLRRKPKSAALRAQLTQRASELASHKKSLVATGGSSFHGTQRRPSGPSGREKGLTTSPAKAATSTRITPLLPTVRSSLRTPTAALKKTKLLDITEQPIAGRDSKKKRKAPESETSVADSKVSKVSEQQQQLNPLQPTDEGKEEDANEPVKEPEEEAKEHQKEKEESSNESQSPRAPPIATPSYALLPGATQQPSYAPAASSTQIEERPGALRIDPNATAATKNLQRELQIRARQQQLLQQQQQQQQQLTQQQQQVQQQKNTEPIIDNNGQFRPLTSAATELSQSLRNDQLSRPEVSMPTLNPFASAGGHLKHYRIQGASAIPSLNNPSQPPPQPQSLPQSAAARSTLPGKKGLSLTREQMLAAQEMFRSANKVTRSEKALIIGFMAGLRENPFPQQGPIITIKLSEENTNVPQADGTTQMVLVEMLFEMNYETGHWRRLKRTRVLAQSLGDESTSSQY